MREPLGESLPDDSDALRARLRELVERAERNETVFRKTLEREKEVLSADSLPRLLDVAVGGLRNSYGLEAVTLVLQDPQHEIRHLLLGDGWKPDSFEGVLFADSVVTLAPQMQTLVRPWLGPYVGTDHQLLFPGASGLGSVAILPLKRNDRLVGALNFGAADPLRFTPEHATDFLMHLAVIVGFALENACNRARLVRAGLTDYLTGWHNKRYFHSRLREEVARAQRHGGAVSLLMIDLDRFKEVNDASGHVGGDAAIREIAQRIESQVRSSDAAARFGGDEFAVLLPGTGTAEAHHLALRILRATSAAPVEVRPGVERTITLSIGIAGIQPGRGDDDHKSLAEGLLAEADAALYRAKAGGRNRVEGPR
jgi:two-component system cell cycle response regulator